MIRVRGCLCKEDLEKLIKDTDWGEPKGKKGNHYKYFDGVIETLDLDRDANDCNLYWRQKKEDWGKTPTVFLKFRTLSREKDYWDQRRGSRASNEPANNNNTEDGIF